MCEVRNEKGMLVGMLDEQTSTFQIKDGKKMWLIPIPHDGLTIIAVKGSGLPEATYIPYSPDVTNPQ